MIAAILLAFVTVSSGDLHVEIDSYGAAARAIRYRGTEFVPRGQHAFTDRLSRNVDADYFEFQDLATRVPFQPGKVLRNKDGTVSCAFALTPKPFPAFTVTKTYAVDARGETLTVTWRFANTNTVAATPLPTLGLGTVLRLLPGEVTTFAQPTADGGVRTYDYPGRCADVEVFDRPSQRWSALWNAADGRGVVIEWPKGRLSGLTNWNVSQGAREATLEFFGVDEPVAPGAAAEMSITLRFGEKTRARIGALPTGALVAKPLLWMDCYNGAKKKPRRSQVSNAPPRADLPAAAQAQRLDREFGVPIGYLTQVSTNVVTPHVAWFKPGPTTEILYVYQQSATYASATKLMKRPLVELAQRMNLTYEVMPLLPEVIAASGPYGVSGTTLAPRLSMWAKALLKERTAPFLAVAADCNFREYPEIAETFRRWKAAGTRFLFIDCGGVPADLLGAAQKDVNRILAILPQMRDKTTADFVGAYGQNDYRAGTLSIESGFRKGNPACPAENLNDLRFPLGGWDFPYAEYGYLAATRLLRWVAGAEGPALIAGATPKELTVVARTAGTYAVETKVYDCQRFELGASRQTVTLQAGENKIAADAATAVKGSTALPTIVHVRLFAPDGTVADAAAYKIPATTTVAALVFDHANRIYNPDETVTVTAAQAGPVEVVGAKGRVVRRFVTEKPTFSFSIPKNPDRLYLVRAPGASGEFSVRHLDRDDADTKAYLTVWPCQTHFIPEYERLGLDYIIGSPSATGRQWARETAKANMQSVPREICYKEEWFVPWKWNNPKAPTARKACFSSDEWRDFITARVMEGVEKCQYDYYNMRLHWLADETCLGMNVCYSPACLAGFRAHLAKVFGSVDALNRAWGTDFATFDAVMPCQLAELKAGGPLGRWLDHKMYMDGVFMDKWAGIPIDLFQANVPGCLCGITGTQPPSYGYDWARAMKRMTALGYYGGVQRKIVHDFATLYGTPLVAGQCGGGYTLMARDYEPYNYDTMWAGLLKGSNLAYCYWGMNFDGDGSATTNMEYWAKSMAELKAGAAKLFLSARAKNEIAVLYSQASLYAATATVGLGKWQNALSSWWRVLADLKYDFTFYPYTLLAENGVPTDIRVLVLPYALALAPAERRALAAFAARGGVILADVQPGIYDEHGSPTAPLADVPLSLVGEKLGGYNSVTLGGEGGETTSASSGSAALIAEVRSTVAGLLAGAGVKPFATVTGADGHSVACDAALRYDGPNAVFALHEDTVGADNNGTSGDVCTGAGRFADKKGKPLRAVLPVKGYIYDVRARRFLGYTDTIETTLIPGWTRLYSILAEKPGELTLEGPSAVRAGETARFAFATAERSETAEGRAQAKGPQVFHVELVAPGGSRPWKFRRNIRTTTGGGAYEFETAFNESTGRWRAEVRHVNTGVVKIHTFDVK